MSLKTPKVAILLAAYNGEEWISEQINTILRQKYAHISLFISVDISNDATLEICRQISQNNNAVKVLPYGDYFGGAGKNFYRLIKDVDFNNFDYISLSDQDDIWLPGKISQAVGILQNKDIGAEAYSSDVIAFWKNGKKKLAKKSYPQRKFDYYFESAGPGCTYVLKRDSAQFLKDFFINNWEGVNRVKSHDWLIYALLRSCNISWHIDDKPLMLYRQHESNQIGANIGLKAYRNRFFKIKKKWYRDEVNNITKLALLASGSVIDLSKSFIVKNFWQLRRKPKDAFILLLVTALGFFK